MARHYMSYWRWDTAIFNLFEHDDLLLGHTASEQLGRVEVGDVVWVVTIDPETKCLYLIGRILVAWKGNQKEVAIRLGSDPDTLLARDGIRRECRII